MAEAGGAEPPCSREKVQLQRQRLLDDMMADLWDLVGQQRYIPDAGLVETISPALRAFLDTGVHGQTAGFTPKGAPLSLYLWGAAGIGKSEFVRVLRESTQQLLRRHVSPQHEVHVVKVLLNSLTASDMRAVANVKGISDMSIERLCEQAIGKNHLVILHFEENPEDPELQAQLYDIAKGILTSLLRRYPDKRANIMYLFTSNYPPAGPLAAELRVVHVTVPSAEKQRQWCVDRLTDTAREVGGVASLDLALDLVPPELGDMRKLRQWWQTIGFHLGRRVLGQRDGVAVSVSRDGDGSATVSVADGEASRLATHDGVFWFDAGRGRHPALDAEGAPEAQQVRLLTVLDMLRHVYLRPAVVVLTGADCGRERCLAALLTLLRAELGDRVRETDVSIREEGDKEKVFGRADEVQGGLFRFIAEANGAARAEDGLFAVVVARVNAVGQFALRELLESGDSSTHRLAVRKDRVLFVLSIDAGVELQPPLSSRAHDVIECA